MENLWPDLDSFDFKTPKEILEEQSIHLQKLTNDLVYAAVEEISSFDDAVEELTPEEGSFTYKFTLRSKFLDRYSFALFAFTHGIDIYPVYIQLDYKVAEELGLSTTITSETEEDFINKLKNFFSTDRTKMVVAAISKLAK